MANFFQNSSDVIRKLDAIKSAMAADSNELLNSSQFTQIQELTADAAQFADSTALNSAQSTISSAQQAAQLAEMQSANEFLIQLGDAVQHAAEADPAHKQAQAAESTSARHAWMSAGTFAHSTAEAAIDPTSPQAGMSNS